MTDGGGTRLDGFHGVLAKLFEQHSEQERAPTYVECCSGLWQLPEQQGAKPGEPVRCLGGSRGRIPPRLLSRGKGESHLRPYGGMKGFPP